MADTSLVMATDVDDILWNILRQLLAGGLQVCGASTDG